MIEIKLHPAIVEFLEMQNKFVSHQTGDILYTVPTEILKTEDKFFITDSIIKIQKWTTIKKDNQGILRGLPKWPFPLLVIKKEKLPRIMSYTDVGDRNIWVEGETFENVQEGDQWTEIALP